MLSTDGLSGSELDTYWWGGLFLGIPLTSMLWGIGCLQLYQYYERYWKSDPRWFGLYMLVIWAIDTAHQVLVIHYNYVYFVKGILDQELLSTLPKSLILITLITGPIIAMIQGILVRRVWFLSNGNRIMTGCLSVAVLVQLALNLTAYFKTSSDTALAQFYGNVPLTFAVMQSSVTIFVDSLLAITLVWLLWRARSGLRSSDSVVNRLVTYIVGSSLLTALFSAISLIGVVAIMHPSISITANAIVPKLYFSCMLASLNARSSLRENFVISVSDITFRLTEPSCLQRPVDIAGNSEAVTICNIVNNVDIEVEQLAQKEYDGISSNAETSRSVDAVV